MAGSVPATAHAPGSDVSAVTACIIRMQDPSLRPSAEELLQHRFLADASCPRSFPGMVLDCQASRRGRDGRGACR